MALWRVVSWAGGESWRQAVRHQQIRWWLAEKEVQSHLWLWNFTRHTFLSSSVPGSVSLIMGVRARVLQGVFSGHL